jgi:arsenate reductase (thioredoxin)
VSDPQPPTLLFVCRHGAAKSVLAAELARRAARRAGVPLQTLARGLEPADSTSPEVGVAIPDVDPSVMNGRPMGLDADDILAATTIVTFDLEPAELPVNVRAIRWDGIPAVSEDPEAARRAIQSRVARLVGGFRASPAADVASEAAS